ncbi:MAG TPA: glycosyltransferase family 2 protein [Steroidobacteraceae bacterium]|jgi:dolichol-phosphate mannosyltransferase|nr:glycosyltransferase family 2 protein [Steroidobacteraceae bacterium]
MNAVEHHGPLEHYLDDTNPTRMMAPLRSGPELAIIVPTFNERGNIAELIRRLVECLGDRSWEVVFVDDDSPDGTADLVREHAQADSRIRCLQRIGRRGLSSACIEGMLATTADYLAVMDADMQHDERLLPQMLDTLKQSDTDIVVGSRYAPGGDIGDWDARRARMSRLAVRLSRLVVPGDLTDPMSGFFMMRRSVLNGTVRGLSAIGFKILADLFASHDGALRFTELAYRFRVRQAGESKLDSVTAWDYLMLLLDKLVGRWIPVRFLAFSIVGAVGVAVHFAVLTLLFQGLQRSFVVGQAVATLCAMTFNYTVNNVLTYRDLRLRGVLWLRGWVSFVLACSIGGFANLGVASTVYGLGRGWFPAAIAGILVGAVWNYAITMMLTWGRARR